MKKRAKILIGSNSMYYFLGSDINTFDPSIRFRVNHYTKLAEGSLRSPSSRHFSLNKPKHFRTLRAQGAREASPFHEFFKWDQKGFKYRI